MGNEKASALPFFHSLTGCDTSFCHGKGKITAWNTWVAFPAVTEAFAALSQVPATIPDPSLVVLEKFVIMMYAKDLLETSDINVACKLLFCRAVREIENIPPTHNAFLQHVK